MRLVAAAASAHLVRCAHPLDLAHSFFLHDFAGHSDQLCFMQVRDESDLDLVVHIVAAIELFRPVLRRIEQVSECRN